MPTPPPTLSADVFCRVVDNYGDIGVCWRLSRQLASEHGFAVRLWVDKLNSFAHICPQIDSRLSVQWVGGVEVRNWPANFAAGFANLIPADVVIETFACHLPEPFIAAMAARDKPPVWINLDYLSAEAWVAGCHGLPSPHPRLPLVKTFFFPGFSEATGGLLRERDLASERDAFLTSPAQQATFWQTFAFSPAPDALLVSLFSYPNRALGDLFAAWTKGAQRVCCLVPESSVWPAVEAFFGEALQAGAVLRRGALEIRVLPFLAQADYDRLLWACDLNFVRGEDSFVRAQWAAKPFVWHIYPQGEDAHLLKLAAFLDLYCNGLPIAAAQALRQVVTAWNGAMSAGRMDADSWARFCAVLPDLRRHAMNWAARHASREDLCSNLVRFCRSKL